MNEVFNCDTFIHDKLAADSTLLTLLGGIAKIYPDEAPQNVTFPVVIISFLASVDRNAVGEYRIFTRPLYTVKAITKGEYKFTNAAAIADRIDAVLQGARGTVNNLEIRGCFRESLIKYIDTEAGVRFNHLGGNYRIFCYEN